MSTYIAPIRICPDCKTEYCPPKQHRCDECRKKHAWKQMEKKRRDAKESYQQKTPKREGSQLCPKCKADYCVGLSHHCPKCKREIILEQKRVTRARHAVRVKEGKVEPRVRTKKSKQEKKLREKPLDISGKLAPDAKIADNIAAIASLAVDAYGLPREGYCRRNYAAINEGIRQQIGAQI